MTGSQGKEAPARRGGKAYLAASFAAQFCALARYTLLARLLGPEQLGLAVALILTSQFFESITDSGSDRFLVQDKQGDEPEVQRLVHFVWLGRGLLIGLALIVLAAPLANFFGAPELRATFPIFALAPIIAGFTHLDFRRIQRSSDFRGESNALAISEIVSLVVTGIAAYLTRDFTAILYGLISRSIAIVLVSHLLAQRRYPIGFASAHARRLGAFALPLMLNGLLLFLGSQGDRLLIGKQVGLTELGHYSAAILLIFYPTGSVQRFLTTIHLPLLAGASEGKSKIRAAERLGGQTLLLALAMLAGFAALSPFIIPLLYGARFEQPAFLLTAIGVLQASRFMRLWPVTTALAQGRSGTVLTSNVIRMLAFPAAIFAAPLIGGLVGIVAAFALAEVLSLVVTTLLAYLHLGARFASCLGRVALYCTACLVILGWTSVLALPSLLALSVLGLLTALLLLWIATQERQALNELYQLRRKFR